jgi:hypothetical protein
MRAALMEKGKEKNGVYYQELISQFSIFENGPDTTTYNIVKRIADAMVRMGGTC